MTLTVAGRVVPRSWNQTRGRKEGVPGAGGTLLAVQEKQDDASSIVGAHAAAREEQEAVRESSTHQPRVDFPRINAETVSRLGESLWLMAAEEPYRSQTIYLVRVKASTKCLDCSHALQPSGGKMQRSPPAPQILARDSRCSLLMGMQDSGHRMLR